LEKGKEALEAFWEYNRILLKLQNLTIKDVSRHDKEIILKKKKNIREV
jgi:hypothetical protein